MSKKRPRSDDDEDEIENGNHDLELEAEMNALASLRAEKSASSGHSKISEGNIYNREGIKQSLETMISLPFAESFEVSEFDLVVQDEHDDLEREVSPLQSD